MAFMTGFFLLKPEYRQEPRRSEVRRFLESLGFEVYDVGVPTSLVFYVEGPSVEALEDVIKAAESHEGIVKAYIAYGFMADRSVQDMVNEMLASGEVELDQSTIEYLKTILARIEEKAGKASQ